MKLIINIILLCTFSIISNAKPFWTEKASYVEGDRVYFVGLSSKSRSVEEGRSVAFENAKHEVFEFLNIDSIEGLTLNTQMSYEEPSKEVKERWDVYRLIYVEIDQLKKLKDLILKKRGQYTDEEVISEFTKLKIVMVKISLQILSYKLKSNPITSS